MDYLRSQANQLRDEPPENRPQDQQPNRHGNAQETVDDLHGGGRLSEPGQPRDGPPGELADRQPDSLDNEQVIDGRTGAMVSIIAWKPSTTANRALHSRQPNDKAPLPTHHRPHTVSPLPEAPVAHAA